MLIRGEYIYNKMGRHQGIKLVKSGETVQVSQTFWEERREKQGEQAEAWNYISGISKVGVQMNGAEG